MALVLREPDAADPARVDEDLVAEQLLGDLHERRMLRQRVEVRLPDPALIERQPVGLEVAGLRRDAAPAGLERARAGVDPSGVAAQRERFFACLLNGLRLDEAPEEQMAVGLHQRLQLRSPRARVGFDEVVCLAAPAIGLGNAPQRPCVVRAPPPDEVTITR